MPSNGILILEKSRLEVLLLKERLAELGFAENHLLNVSSLADLTKAEFLDMKPGFVFVDLFLQDSAGVNTFLCVQRTFPNVPIVILTDIKEKTTAAQCIHLGAQDYLVKGEFSNQLLSKTIRFATERNAYRQELEKLQGDYRKLFEDTPLPMWIFDRNTMRFLAVNRACVEKYGFSMEEFAGMTLEDLHPEDEREKVRLALERSRPDSVSARGRFRHRTRDGQVINAEIFSSPVLYKDSPALLVTSLDVTDQVQAEENERLARQEREHKHVQLESILDSLPDIFILLDNNCVIQFWNRAAEQAYGISRADAIGQIGWDVLPGSIQNLHVPYEQALRTQQSVLLEYKSPILKRWTAIAIHPTPGGLTVHVKDLTEERQRNMAIMETRDNYQALIDFTLDDIWSVNQNLELIAANRAFQDRIVRLMGQPMQKGESIIPPEMLPEEAAKWRQRYAQALAGEPIRIHDAVRFHNGELILMEVQFNPIRDGEGAVVGVACHSHVIQT